MTRTILALDAGTTGVTGIIFDSDLYPRARAYREFPQGFPEPGRVEHRAEDILGALDEVVAELLADAAAADLCAIGLTNQRETIFALDRTSGEALRPGIVWQDRRTAARCAELRSGEHAASIRAKTGLVLDPYFSASKIEWMLREDPSLAARMQAGDVVFGTVDTLVLAHLCGNERYLTDPTNASRTMLFDLDARAFDSELCEVFGVAPSALAEVLDSTANFGTTLPARTGGRGLPVCGLAGDQQAALFGQGAFDPGGLKVTFGTGSFLLLNLGEQRRDSAGGLLTTLAVGRQGEAVYALEGSVFVCGAAVQWLRDGLGFFDDAAEVEALAREVEDTGGVYFVPAFAGLGAPYWDAEARGALLGLTRGTNRAHIARAALEGIAFQNAELIELLREESGLAIEAMQVDGGATRNELLLALQADLAGVRVLRGADVEATARGAAALAGLGAGVWEDPSQAAALSADTREFVPTLPDTERTERLAAWRQAVARVRTPQS